MDLFKLPKKLEKQIKDPHNHFQITLGLSAVAIFLVTASLVPYVGRKLGLLGQPKPSAQAAEKVPEEKELTAQFMKACLEHFKAEEKDKEGKKNSLVEASKKRKDKLLNLIEENPRAVLAVKLSKQQGCAQLPEVSANIEEEVTLEGTLEILHEDNFENQTSRDRLYLKKDKERYSLHTSDELPTLRSGTKVKVHGIKIDNKIAFDQKNTLEILSAPGPEPVLGAQQTAVILANFANTTQPNITSEYINDLVFTQANNFFKENSYNKTELAGAVYGWYQLPINKTCDGGPLTNAVLAAANTAVDFSQLNHLIIIAPLEGCTFAGVGSLGKYEVETPDGNVLMSVSKVQSNRTGDFGVIAHELGHGFGVHHAGFLNCQTASIAPDGCSPSEYGDVYSVMGQNTAHLNSYHKEYLGWLSGHIADVKGDGDFVVNPIESNGIIRALKIQRGESDYLYVEYRQPIGFDSILGNISGSNVFNGALIHTVGQDTKSHLIDTTLPDPSNLTTIVGVGGSFTDPATGTRIVVRGKNANSLLLTVDVGNITDFVPPEVSITEPAADAVVTGTVTVSANATDASGISKVEFFLQGQSTPFVTDREAPFTFQWDTSAQPDGPMSIFARAYDKAADPFGGTGNRNESFSVNLILKNYDFTPPAVVLADYMTPVPGSTNRKIYMGIFAKDEQPISKVEFWRSGSEVPYATVDVSISSDPVYGESFFSEQVIVPSGDYTIWAVAYDAVLNMAKSQEISFSIDANPPTVLITSPPSGQLYTRTVTINVDASDDAGVTSVQFYGPGLGYYDPTAPYSATFDIKKLPPGNNTIGVFANDAAGPSYPPATITFIKDNDADSDGFYDSEETYFGTDPNKACADSNPGGGPSQTWPADLNTTTSGINSLNKINIADLQSFTSPTRRLNTSPGDPGYDKRWDLVPGKGNFSKDINLADLQFLTSFTAPMFDNIKAFNGPFCGSRPDLTAELVDVAQTYQFSTPIVFSGKLQNAGSLASSTGTIRFYIDGNDWQSAVWLSGAPTLTLQGGQSSELFHANGAWDGTLGTHTIYLCADAYNGVNEINEDNNCDSQEFTVLDPPSPLPSPPPYDTPYSTPVEPEPSPTVTPTPATSSTARVAGARTGYFESAFNWLFSR